MTNIELRAVVQTLENGVQSAQAPLQRLEHIWHYPVAYLVIPIFALVNAGVPMTLASLEEAVTHPVMLGISLGLVLGKFVGITGTCWVVLKLGIAELPKRHQVFTNCRCFTSRWNWIYDVYFCRPTGILRQ